MLEKVGNGHGSWRVKRETCEKGAMWTDPVPVSLVPPGVRALIAVYLTRL